MLIGKSNIRTISVHRKCKNTQPFNLNKSRLFRFRIWPVQIPSLSGKVARHHVIPYRSYLRTTPAKLVQCHKCVHTLTHCSITPPNLLIHSIYSLRIIIIKIWLRNGRYWFSRWSACVDPTSPSLWLPVSACASTNRTARPSETVRMWSLLVDDCCRCIYIIEK